MFVGPRPVRNTLARTERSQERTGDAARAFIRHIGKQIDGTEQEDENGGRISPTSRGPVVLTRTTPALAGT